MLVKINDIEYRILNDWVLKESVGSTSLMDITLDCTNKDIPQPFDLLQIGDEGVIIGNDLLSDGLSSNVTVTSSIKLSRVNPNFDGTWLSLVGRSWNELIGV